MRSIKETFNAESIPIMNSLAIEPVMFVVPINISKATDLGTEAEATDIAMTKLPRTPIFCNVLSRPDRLP